MNEFAPLTDYVSQYVSLTEEEEAYFISQLRYVKVKKKQTILNADYTCRYRTFIVRGSMRAYIIDPAGKEHNILLGIENWWIMDFESYMNQTPATLIIQAWEDCEVIQLDLASEQRLIEHSYKFERLFNKLCHSSYIYLQQRMVSRLSKTSEQRYRDFLLRYASMEERFPQYIIASYLGFTTQFLSQIKNAK